MPRHRSTALAVALVLLSAAVVVGQGSEDAPRRRRFVSVSGDDGGAGTRDVPWRTIQHAVDSARPGDTIVVLPGRYRGARIGVSGAPGRRIVLRAARGEVILTGPGRAARHGSTLEIESFGRRVSHWSIRRLEVVGGDRSAIDVRGAERIALVGNLVRDSGRSGIFTAFADRVRIVGNESRDNGEHGVYVSNSGDGQILRRNWIHDNAAAGIHMNGDLSQGGDGVISRVIIARNVIHGNGRLGASGINLDGVDRARIRNNLLFDEHASGISLYRIDGAVCTSRARVEHNTVLLAADGRWALNMADRGCRRNRAVNNILLSAHPFRGSIAIGPSAPGFAAHHNVVLDRFSADGGETVIPLSAWRARGLGSGSIVASPGEVFVDAPGHDFRPRAGSPARDAGARIPAVRRDLHGERRPRCGGWDIGAIEARCE